MVIEKCKYNATLFKLLMDIFHQPFTYILNYKRTQVEKSDVEQGLKCTCKCSCNNVNPTNVGKIIDKIVNYHKKDGKSMMKLQIEICHE